MTFCRSPIFALTLAALPFLPITSASAQTLCSSNDTQLVSAFNQLRSGNGISITVTPVDPSQRTFSVSLECSPSIPENLVIQLSLANNAMATTCNAGPVTIDADSQPACSQTGCQFILTGENSVTRTAYSTSLFPIHYANITAPTVVPASIQAAATPDCRVGSGASRTPKTATIKLCSTPSTCNNSTSGNYTYNSTIYFQTNISQNVT